MPKLLLIVEGDGDVVAIPTLARRVLGEFYGIYDWNFETHRRKDMAHLVANDGANFKRYLQAALHEEMPILWTIDCDDGCAVRNGCILSSYAQQIGVFQPMAFSFWVREYEAIFLYDPDTVKSKLGIQPQELAGDLSQRRGVKELISSLMPRGKKYKERIDQPALTANINLELPKANYRSFQHFEKALHWLTQQRVPALYPLRGC